MRAPRGSCFTLWNSVFQDKSALSPLSSPIASAGGSARSRTRQMVVEVFSNVSNRFERTALVKDYVSFVLVYIDTTSQSVTRMSKPSHSCMNVHSILVDCSSNVSTAALARLLSVWLLWPRLRSGGLSCPLALSAVRRLVSTVALLCLVETRVLDYTAHTSQEQICPTSVRSELHFRLRVKACSSPGEYMYLCILNCRGGARSCTVRLYSITCGSLTGQTGCLAAADLERVRSL